MKGILRNSITRKWPVLLSLVHNEGEGAGSSESLWGPWPVFCLKISFTSIASSRALSKIKLIGATTLLGHFQLLSEWIFYPIARQYCINPVLYLADSALSQPAEFSFYERLNVHGYQIRQRRADQDSCGQRKLSTINECVEILNGKASSKLLP